MENTLVRIVHNIINCECVTVHKSHWTQVTVHQSNWTQLTVHKSHHILPLFLKRQSSGGKISQPCRRLNLPATPLGPRRWLNRRGRLRRHINVLRLHTGTGCVHLRGGRTCRGQVYGVPYFTIRKFVGCRAYLSNNPERLCELGVSFLYDSWLPDPNIGTTLKLWRLCTTTVIHIALYFGLFQSHRVSHSVQLSRCVRRSNVFNVQLGAEWTAM